MKILVEATDVEPEMLACVADCLDWFEGEPLRTQEFIDRLCESYGSDFDIESYDNGAVRLIMAHARRLRREAA